MSTHPSVEASRRTGADDASERDNIAEVLRVEDREDPRLFRTLSTVRDVAPIAYMPPPLAESSNTRNWRRILTREQGRALETIGHAVDYLNDCYLYEGDDAEPIDVSGFSSEAIQILVSLRWQILQSAPLHQPRPARLWNALFRRRADHRPGVAFQRAEDRTRQSKPAAVLPLSSSR
ncbi:MAG: hypothetical protein ACYCOR_02075 [Acidobacteriaceae bacterium]